MILFYYIHFGTKVALQLTLFGLSPAISMPSSYICMPPLLCVPYVYIFSFCLPLSLSPLCLFIFSHLLYLLLFILPYSILSVFAFVGHGDFGFVSV